MFAYLGRLSTAHSWKICIGWLVVGAVLAAVAPSWDTSTQDDDIDFLPGRCASVRAYHLMQQAFPRDIAQSKLIVALERSAQPLGATDLRLVDLIVDEVDQLRREAPALEIGKVTSYRDGLIGQRLLSADRHCTLIQIALGKPYLAVQTRKTVDEIDARLGERLAAVDHHQVSVFMTGPAGIGRDLIRASAGGLQGTTIATVILVIVILLFVYRSPILALVPLLSIAASVWVALNLLALLTQIPGVHLVSISRVFAIVVLYGAGTDYCLFLISRYQERVAEGKACRHALAGSLAEIGSPLAASAGTVICGLGLMGFAEFAKVRCAGPAIGLGLVVALLASLTLAPSLLHILGTRAFWPGPVPGHKTARLPGRQRWQAQAQTAGRFWEWVSRGVVARPVLVWSVAALSLAPLALVGLSVTPIYRPTGELRPGDSSVQGLAAIQRHFTAGEIGPITVLLAGSRDWASPKGREAIAYLSRGFAYLPNVAEVRSLTQPLGQSLPKLPSAMQSSGLLGQLWQVVERPLEHLAEHADQSARDFYTARISTDAGRVGGGQYVTRLDVVLRSDPFHPRSMSTLQELQYWLDKRMTPVTTPVGPVRAECYGVTANAHDLAVVTNADRRRVNVLVLGGVFAILLLVVRRPWLAAYLLITVLFSYFATLGATTLVAHWWSGRPLGQVDWRVPFFLFTILVAIGEDYNIFVITRMLEERRRFGPIEGVRRAIAHTGSTITCCGLIMAGTFATLMLAGLSTLVQIGFALGFGVLLDTFVIRPVLVPALTLCVWRYQDGEGPITPLLPARRRPLRSRQERIAS